MEKISINEALVVMLISQDNVDATNVIQKLRKGKENLYAFTQEHSRYCELTDYDAELDAEFVDDVLIFATRNGKYDLFK